MLVTIIADASYCSDTGAMGYAYSITTDDRTTMETARDFTYGSLAERVENSTVAEIIAIGLSIDDGLKKGLIHRGDYLLIQTDCTAAISAIRSERNWRPGKEEAMLNFILALCHQNALTVECRHVQGHSDNNGARFHLNRRCDKYARIEMRKRREQITAQQSISKIKEVLYG